MKTLLSLSVVLLIGCSTTNSTKNELNIKSNSNPETLYEYQKKVLYANSEYPELLLDKAKFFRDIGDRDNYYRFAKGAFIQYHILQQGIFSIFDKKSKSEYLQEHKKYIDELFSATNPLYYIDTLNQWLNYKRTHFDYENSLISIIQKTENQKLKSTWGILNKEYKTLSKLNQQERYIKKISVLNKKIERFEKQLSTYMIDNFTKKTVDYRDIVNLLSDNELYIDFAKKGENYYYFALDKQENIQFKKIDRYQTKEIDDYIQGIKEDLDNVLLKRTKTRYSKLYNLIFKNINLKNKTSLIISPDGLLNTIPFEAFYDGEKFLIQKLKIRYIPSGKELVKLYRDKSKTKSSDIVVFADVNFDNKNSNLQQKKGDIFNSLTSNNHYLKYSKKDAEVVKKLFPNHAKLFLKERATEENLLKVNAPKILYLSTHGTFLRDKSILNPMLKSIILLDGANESIRQKRGNGIVSGLELAGLNLLGTELVVLSACETGVGEIEDSEGIAGLSKAFMEAGAKNVIMTLWSVNDKKSSELMEKFFEGIKNGFGYSDALRKAKIWMIEDDNGNPHPFYWSGFVGSGRD